MQVIKPESLIQMPKYPVSMFLAGAIDQGSARDWQKEVEAALEDVDVTIYNPRNDSWRAWEVQSKDNPYFRNQVEWELNRLRKSDIIILVLPADSKAPISLLELGLNAGQTRVVVCCEEGFYRKGNIDIVCEMYNIPNFPVLDDAIAFVKEKVIKVQSTYNKLYIR